MNFYLELFLKYSNLKQIFCGFLATPLSTQFLPLQSSSAEKRPPILPTTEAALEFEVQEAPALVCYCCNLISTFQLDEMMVFALKNEVLQ